MTKASTSNFEQHTVSRSETVSLLTHLYFTAIAFFSVFILVETNLHHLWKNFGKNISPEGKMSTSVVNFFHNHVCPLELCKVSLWQNFPFPACAHIVLKPMTNSEVPEVSFSFSDTGSLKHNPVYIPMDNVWRQKKNGGKTRGNLRECLKHEQKGSAENWTLPPFPLKHLCLLYHVAGGVLLARFWMSDKLKTPIKPGNFLFIRYILQWLIADFSWEINGKTRNHFSVLWGWFIG